MKGCTYRQESNSQYTVIWYIVRGLFFKNGTQYCRAGPIISYHAPTDVCLAAHSLTCTQKWVMHLGGYTVVHRNSNGCSVSKIQRNVRVLSVFGMWIFTVKNFSFWFLYFLFQCPIEWFHFACVGLTTKPKGKWFCPKCTADRKKK